VGRLFLPLHTPPEHPGSDSESIGRVFIFLSLFGVAVEQKLVEVLAGVVATARAFRCQWD
jgi:hypothetical protein